MYMNIHVPSMLAIGIETINKQTQQTNKLIKFIKHSHKGNNIRLVSVICRYISIFKRLCCTIANKRWLNDIIVGHTKGHSHSP